MRQKKHESQIIHSTKRPQIISFVETCFNPRFQKKENNKIIDEQLS